MPASLETLRAKELEVSVDFGDGDLVQVRYRVNAYDEATEELMFAMAAEGRHAAAIRRVCQDTIVSWDLMADAKLKKPIPITEEGLKTVPVPVLQKVYAAIGADRQEQLSPNRVTGSS